MAIYDKMALAEIGKRASDLFLKHELPLTEAIVKVASKLPNFTDEHLKRVIENANLVTFEEMFKAAESKHITFDLAEFSEVKQKMQDDLHGGKEPTSMEYLTPPDAPKVESSIFDRTPFEKESSYSYVPEHVTNNRDRHHVKQAQAHVVEWLLKVDNELQNEVAVLNTMCKKASLVHGQESVSYLLGSIAKDRETLTKIASIIDIPVADNQNKNQVPNSDHPIVNQYNKCVGLVKEAKRLRGASVYLENQRQKLLHTVGH
jgi:hypothetical protein